VTERDAALLALGAGALGAALLLLLPGSPLAKRAEAVSGGWAGTTWSPQKPRVPHYCRGGLYHPDVAGEGRTGLLMHGWAWITDPPSERTGPGVADG
jgi:hypothetical protein